MKRLILFISFVVCFILSKGQSGYPIPQSLGGDSVLVTSKGGLKLRPVLYGYADTSAANAQRISQYPFAQICTNDDKYWIRNFTATRWLQVNTGGGSGGVDSVTSQKTTNCTDILSYWIGATRVRFDTIQLYDVIVKY